MYGISSPKYADSSQTRRGRIAPSSPYKLSVPPKNTAARRHRRNHRRLLSSRSSRANLLFLSSKEILRENSTEYFPRLGGPIIALVANTAAMEKFRAEYPYLPIYTH